MKTNFTSLSYGSCISLLQQAKGNPVDLWYFVIKTTPGIFKVVEPTACRIIKHSTINNRPLFQYKSQKGNWLKTENYSFKNNARYFTNKTDAQEAFKILVESAKVHFKKQMVSADHALNVLDKY